MKIIFLWQIFALNSMTGDRRVNGAGFGAVTDSLQEHLRQLYLQEWNGDQPSVLDQATKSATAQFEICQDITRSGVFAVYSKYLVNNFAEARTKLTVTQSSNRDSILQPSSIVGPTTTSDAYENLYHLQQIPVNNLLPDQPDGTDEPEQLEMKKEYTFACFLEEYPRGDEEKKDWTSRIVAVYVSKVYNTHRGLWAHRFVFHEVDGSVDVMLAERSADVYTRPDFNVELHYLELRKHREPASSCDLDPVCKLTLIFSPRTGSQALRLCEIVLSSSYFREKFEYPLRVHMGNYGWCHEKISFRTTEGRAAAAAAAAQVGEYSELMLTCLVMNKQVEGPQIIYISRAYNAHQVFVYFQEPRQRNFYLENLSINVGIVREPYRLEDVEI